MHKTKIETFLESLINIPRHEFMQDKSLCTIYLKRTKEFSKYLGSPEKNFKYIHVAGTSGKGSTVRMIASIFKSAGKRCGVYTSPHITKFTERFAINDSEAHGNELDNFLPIFQKALQDYIKKGSMDIPSYFELDFLLALLYFKSKKVKWVVLETGCGGRFDATNIIPAPQIAIITNIGLDHTEILGNTLKEIAFEKIGIVKRGSKVFIGNKNRKINKLLLEYALRQGASKVVFINKPVNFELKAYGHHQKLNAALAQAAAKELKINEKYIIRGLKNVRIRAAFDIVDIVKRNPTIIIDGAHNTDKMTTTALALNDFLKSHSKSKVHLIMATSQNKNTKAMLKIILPYANFIYATRFTKNIFRKCTDPRAIASYASKLKKIKAQPYISAENAFFAALKTANNNDIIISTGSIFLAGEMYGIIKNFDKYKKFVYS